MKLPASILLFLSCVFLLSSCEFNCSVGQKDKNSSAVSREDEPRIYNNINLKATGLKVEKAYLIFENGDGVPENNAVDFTSPVKMIVKIDTGWVVQNDKVMIGASEKIISEDGTVLLDKPDLFADDSGVSPQDAKAISIWAQIRLREGSPPASFTISFRIWDKNGKGTIEGNYKLYSK